MSTKESANQVPNYAEVLDISIHDPEEFGKMINLAKKTRKNVLCGIGEAGVGKSAIVYQVARQRGVPFQTANDRGVSVVLHAPQMNMSDICVAALPKDPQEGKERYFQQLISEMYWPLFNCTPEQQAAGPILLIEEPNRARDRAVTAAIFTMIGDRRIGTVTLPDYVQIVVLMNPSAPHMATNGFEQDSAMRRRITLVGITPNLSKWLKYAAGAGFHKKVVSYLTAQPSRLYDEKASWSGRVFACPASWEAVSETLHAADADKIPYMSSAVMAQVRGKIGGASASLFEAYLEDEAGIISPDQIFQEYTEGSALQRRVRNLKDDRIDQIAELVGNLLISIQAEPNRLLENPANIARLMSDLPEESFTVFMRGLNDFDVDKEPDKRRKKVQIQKALSSAPDFRGAMKRYDEAMKKVRENVRNQKG